MADQTGLLDKTIGQMPTGQSGQTRAGKNLFHPFLSLGQQTAQRATATVFTAHIHFEASLERNRPLDGLQNLQDGNVGR